METAILIAILAFSIALLIAVLLSETPNRTALSATVIFLVAGFLAGNGALDLIQVRASDETILTFV